MHFFPLVNQHPSSTEKPQARGQRNQPANYTIISSQLVTQKKEKELLKKNSTFIISTYAPLCCPLLEIRDFSMCFNSQEVVRLNPLKLCLPVWV